jgi:hypothetical protein
VRRGKKMRGVHNAICSLFNNLREEEEEKKESLVRHY